MFRRFWSFLTRLFSSPVLAQIAIGRVLANNPERALPLILAARSAVDSVPRETNIAALEYLLKKKGGYDYLLTGEQLLFDEVLAAIRTDLDARSAITFDAAPLLTWLSKQGV
jgi:hypothetical protein